MDVEVDAQAVGAGLWTTLQRCPQMLALGKVTGDVFLHEHAAQELLLDWADGRIEDWGNAPMPVKQRAAASLTAFLLLLVNRAYQGRTWRVPADLPPEDQARRALALEIRGTIPPERSLQ